MTRAIFLSLIGLLCLCGFARAEIYSPEGGVRPSKGKVDLELIRLITDQNVIERRISVKRLAAFIKLAETSVARSVPPNASPFRLCVRVTLSPRSRPKFDLKYNDGKVPRGLLQSVYDGLQKLSDTRPNGHDVVFQLDFVIKAKA